MRILLIVPAAENRRVTAERLDVPRRRMLRFSVLPLTAVAGATPDRHHVELCDENVQPLDLEADVDVVGLSLMTATAKRGYAIAAEFRRRGKIVVAGGYHATLVPDDVVPHVDAVVVGDAEGTWPRLLEDVEAGRLEPVYRSERPFDLAQLPTPRRELTDGTARHYVTTNAIQVGRGCKHACRYCSITAFHGRTYRARPIEHVLEELKGLPRDLIFVDDNLIADSEYAKRLFERMIPLRKRWVTQCSISIADDPELLRLAQQAGCVGLFIGVETTNQANLHQMGKSWNDSKSYAERIRAIHRAGIGVIAGIIVGMDGDDVGVFERTLRFLQKTGIDALQLNIMTPLPGTPLYDDLERQRRIVDHDWNHYDFRHAVIQPARMSRSELQEGTDWLLAQFYRLDRVLLRTVRTLFHCGPHAAYLAWRLNRTYRYDIRRDGIAGRNPATDRDTPQYSTARAGRTPMRMSVSSGMFLPRQAERARSVR